MKLILALLVTQCLLFWNLTSASEDSHSKESLSNENLFDNDNSEASSTESTKSKRFSYFYKRNDKKFRPIVYDGYSLDINIDIFRSTRRCNMNEVCKGRYKPFFECVCPTNSLCVGPNRFVEAKCSSSLSPYIWIQTGEDMSNIKPKL